MSVTIDGGFSGLESEVTWFPGFLQSCYAMKAYNSAGTDAHTDTPTNTAVRSPASTQVDEIINNHAVQNDIVLFERPKR